MVWTSDVPSSDQLRDLKKTELLKAAARYFSRHGYHGASLTEIAKALGLTKSAIYYYYSDKQSLLFECSKWAHEAILLLDEGTDTDPLVRLRTLCVAYVELVVEHELGFMMFSDLENLSESECRSIIALRDRFEQRIRSLLGEARESGKLGASDPKMTALMILGSLNWMQKWFDPGGPMSATQIADQFVRVTIAGLGAVEAEDQNRSMRELNLHSPSGVSFEVKIACIRALDKDFLPQAAPAVAQTAGSGRIRPRSRCFLAQGRRFSAQRTDLSSRFRSV